MPLAQTVIAQQLNLSALQCAAQMCSPFSSTPPSIFLWCNAISPKFMVHSTRLAWALPPPVLFLLQPWLLSFAAGPTYLVCILMRMCLPLR